MPSKPSEDELKEVLEEKDSEYDQDLARRFKECVDKQFPVCLDLALQDIFGDNGMEVIRSAAKKESIYIPNIVNVSSSMDVWWLYLWYLASWEKVLGKNSTSILEHKSLIKMRELHCEKCPMYSIEIDRLEKKSTH